MVIHLRGMCAAFPLINEVKCFVGGALTFVCLSTAAIIAHDNNLFPLQMRHIAEAPLKTKIRSLKCGETHPVYFVQA